MLVELFELASNNALEHDPETLLRLQKLQGKSMTLHVKTINQSITVTPSPEGVELTRDTPETVDVTLTATPAAMLKITRDGIDGAELQPGELEISGDPIIGQRFATIIAELNINWTSLLSDHIGDSPAKIVTLAAGQVRGFAEQSKSQLHKRFISFIKEEIAVTAERDDVDNFLDNVDSLRADSDRLIARLTRIQQTTETN